MFLLLLPLPAEELIAHFQAFKCKRIQNQAGLFSTFCFIAHNCTKGALKSEPDRTGFTQNFDSASGSWSGGKLQNPAGVDSVPLAPLPPLPPNMHCNHTSYPEQKTFTNYYALFPLHNKQLCPWEVGSLDDPRSFAAFHSLMHFINRCTWQRCTGTGVSESTPARFLTIFENRSRVGVGFSKEEPEPEWNRSGHGASFSMRG